MKTQHFALLGLALAMAGCMPEDRTISMQGQGGSTATITQDDGASRTVTRTTSGPEGQTIVRKQGSSTAVVRQGSGSGADVVDDGSMELRVSDSFRSRFLNRITHD